MKLFLCPEAGSSVQGVWLSDLQMWNAWPKSCACPMERKQMRELTTLSADANQIRGYVRWFCFINLSGENKFIPAKQINKRAADPQWLYIQDCMLGRCTHFFRNLSLHCLPHLVLPSPLFLGSFKSLRAVSMAAWIPPSLWLHFERIDIKEMSFLTAFQISNYGSVTEALLSW